MSLGGHKDLLDSLISGADASTSLLSMLTTTWRCLNPNHDERKTKVWEEILRSRVKYRFCPNCSPRCRGGVKCQDCEKGACYNYDGEQRGAFCLEHCREKMVDVKHSRCKEIGCMTRAVFGLPGESIPSRCVTHKTGPMIDITSKKCAKEGCATQPIYGTPEEGIPIYCAKHAPDGTVDVKNKKCAEAGCAGRPRYTSSATTPIPTESTEKKLRSLTRRERRLSSIGSGGSKITPNSAK